MILRRILLAMCLAAIATLVIPTFLYGVASLFLLGIGLAQSIFGAKGSTGMDYAPVVYFFICVTLLVLVSIPFLKALMFDEKTQARVRAMQEEAKIKDAERVDREFWGDAGMKEEEKAGGGKKIRKGGVIGKSKELGVTSEETERTGQKFGTSKELGLSGQEKKVTTGEVIGKSEELGEETEKRTGESETIGTSKELGIGLEKDKDKKKEIDESEIGASKELGVGKMEEKGEKEEKKGGEE